MQAIYDIAAPAKLNLFLHVTGRRADGWHLLQSVLVLIDWMDVLHVEARRDGGLGRTDLGDALPPDDLCLRAAHALKAATGCTAGAQISIDKRIPAQAGMGGGSSDAASCLLALNRLWRLGLSRQALQRIGLQLGADVPFFLCGHSAWVEGVGDIVHPLVNGRALPEVSFAVAKPPGGLDTSSVFSSPALTRDTRAATMRDFAAGGLSFGRNDLQPAAQALCPEVTQALQWLSAQGLAARMTGSGSAVFAQAPRDVALEPPPAGWKVRVCSNLQKHPLADWVC